MSPRRSSSPRTVFMYVQWMMVPTFTLLIPSRMARRMSSPGIPVPIGGSDPRALAVSPDGATVYAASDCGNCHGADGASGFAVSIACFPADGLDTYVRREGTPHAGITGIVAGQGQVDALLLGQALPFPVELTVIVDASRDIPLHGRQITQVRLLALDVAEG